MEINFKLWLEVTEISNLDYMHPDQIYGPFHRDPRTHTFIFTQDKKMYYGDKKPGESKPWYSHYDVMNFHHPVFDKYKNNDLDKDHYDIDSLHNNELIGRVGPLGKYYPDILLVSFWGSNQDLFKQLIPDCLNKLAKDNVIDLQRDAISTVHDKTQLIRDSKFVSQASPEELEHQKLMRDLHLMNPIAKKAAMEKLGLSTGKPSQYPRYWALNSENKI